MGSGGIPLVCDGGERWEVNGGIPVVCDGGEGWVVGWGVGT